ncbi:MFS transporter [Horticoccus luteus]|uniref:MFS transporter n=1 Tax=Horticoccus luteus TaxID=2862869 RepID=A0A8F9TWU8_9BACT|nr:MFS transporter [Horticoccus luteus]QYM79512.1 MFS transporter [Horticoccus luteus]
MSSVSTVSPFDPPPVRKREIFGWCCFDFANSAFTTVIITVVYAVYFMRVVAGNDPRGPGWWGTALAVSQVVVILLAPLLGAVADVTARKKTFLMGSAVVCSIATAALYFTGAGDVWLALALVIVANMTFSLGENFCAAFLPEISTAENVGRISGFGWAFGYLGGLVSLVLALVILQSGEGRAPWTFVMTGAFFLLACLPTLLLRERARRRSLAKGESYVSLAWGQIREMRRDLPQHRTLARFFLAMTLYMVGLTAVIAFASVFATQTLHMTQSEVIVLFIVLQVAGVAGAYGFGLLQDRLGAKVSLVLSLALWLIVCGWAAVCHTKGEFYAIGVIAGAAMGSLQSSGRAVVSGLTPPGRGGEFFGYWGFFGKLAGVFGPFMFGWVTTGFGFQAAIVVTGLFFASGLAVVAALPFGARRR